MAKETALLRALQLGKAEAFEQLYKNAFAEVHYYIKSNSGTPDDAQDVFQEALVVLVRKIRQTDFQLTGKIGGLLIVIAKKMWLKHLRDSKKSPLRVADKIENWDVIQEDEIALKMQKEAKHEMIAEQFKTLGNECREVIMHRIYHKISTEEVAKMLNYKSAYVRVKLSKCLKYLRKKVEAHPDFQKLSQYET